jgi:phosphatidylserine/phosphatidylglycerophosphate/cardiolipin synthase-like enzyme
MQRVIEGGVVAEQLGTFLETIAADRERRSSAADVIELVSSGPEAPGVANRDTRIVVREVFRSAEDSVLVAGYAVYQGREIFGALADRMDQTPQLRVKMYLDVQRPRNDTSSPEELVQRFARRFRTEEWPGSRLPDVYYDPRSLELNPLTRASLHAKCIVVDGQVSFVSSANFTSAAQLRNIEIGLLVRSTWLGRRLADHFAALAHRGILVRVPL